MDTNLSQLVTNLWQNPRTMTESRSISICPGSVLPAETNCVAFSSAAVTIGPPVTTTRPQLTAGQDPDLDRLRYSL